jgi:metalloendopeptidase OMA1, mitochondrial
MELPNVFFIMHVYSLEQVPETGRWRFMNTSHEAEMRVSEIARRSAIEEYRDTMLPVNHMLSRHVRRVVSRILASSNLGVVRGGDTTLPYGVGGGEEGWDPDAELKPGMEKPEEEREWDVIVVNDPKMINAQVMPGINISSSYILATHRTFQGLLLSIPEFYPYAKTNKVSLLSFPMARSSLFHNSSTLTYPLRNWTRRLAP